MNMYKSPLKTAKYCIREARAAQAQPTKAASTRRPAAHVVALSKMLQHMHPSGAQPVVYDPRVDECAEAQEGGAKERGHRVVNLFEGVAPDTVCGVRCGKRKQSWGWKHAGLAGAT